jgi:hypothetical protein
LSVNCNHRGTGANHHNGYHQVGSHFHRGHNKTYASRYDCCDLHDSAEYCWSRDGQQYSGKCGFNSGYGSNLYWCSRKEHPRGRPTNLGYSFVGGWHTVNSFR